MILGNFLSFLILSVVLFQVVLYTWELQNIKNISGSQIGAYFGYSIASGDIDGDGFDDVIVGAPMFTRTKSDGFEHGRIYVIYQDKDRVRLSVFMKLFKQEIDFISTYINAPFLPQNYLF